MTKTIDTLVDDIYGLLGSGVEIKDEDVDRLANAMAKHIRNALSKRPEYDPATPGLEVGSSLRASKLGTPCDAKTWFDEHTHSDTREDPSPWTKIKFLYGHLIEELVLFLAEQSGHSVVSRQDELSYKGVSGHPDCIIDGYIVDVKSANSRGMSKFRTNGLATDDPFNYLTQLCFYYTAMRDSIPNKDKVYFLAVDKELGHLVLDGYSVDDSVYTHIDEFIEHKKNILKIKQRPPRYYMPEPDGKSGNKQLCTQCRYCEHKFSCWDKLRVFKYSNGPRFLTSVVRTPDVPEITKEFLTRENKEEETYEDA